MVSAETLSQRIEQGLPGAKVVITDLTGTQDHYQVEVIAEAFTDVLPLQRHRMVYGLVKDVLGGALHAMALTTQTPAEAQQRQSTPT